MRILHKDMQQRDRGAALLVVIGIGAVMTAFAFTAITLTTNNLKNTVRDKQANSALATSEAGVAEAVEYLRSAAKLTSLGCMEPVPLVEPSPVPAGQAACYATTQSWTSKKTPMRVAVDGGGSTCTVAQTCYLVWISTVVAYDPVTAPVGKYLVHSTGKFGNGPASRSVVVDVSVRPYPFPLGVFAETFTGAGGVGITRESLFTRNCLTGRAADGSTGGGLRFGGDVDLAHDMPPSAHSTDAISTGSSCVSPNGTESGNVIHKPGLPCNLTVPDYYDQSRGGADLSGLTGTVCFRKWTSLQTGRKYPETSLFTTADLQQVGYRPRGLSDDVYDTLASRAKASGTYFTDRQANPFTALNALGGAQAVLYYKVPFGDKVTLGPTNFPAAYLRTEQDSGCTGNPIIIVVEGGDLTLNSVGNGNSNPVTGIATSIFVPDGAYAGQGSVWVIGTLFAKEAKLAGTQDFRLDKCFVKNPPSAVIDVQVDGFREDDSGNAG